jgi:hypothetical protein
MTVDPMLRRVLVIFCYLLLLLISFMEAAAVDSPIPYTQQGQVGVYHLQLTAASVPRAGRRFELTLTSRSPRDLLQISTAMLASTFPTAGSEAISMPSMPLAPRRASKGVYTMLVRYLPPGWWFLLLVVQGNRGTARGVISLRVEEPSPPPWLVWRIGLLTLALLIYVVWEHNRHEPLNDFTCVHEVGIEDSLW